MISDSWVRERRFAMPRLLPRRLRSMHTLALALALVLVGWLGWTWYRSSSFVKVEKVTVTGLGGPDVRQIRDDLTNAALTMTTLDVDLTKLEAAVSRYGYVQRLTVSGAGAHGLVIHVDEQVPVALVEINGQTQVVDADGRLLPGTTSHGALPTVPLSGTSLAGETITAPGARAAIAALAAAPYALLAHVAGATSSRAHGVIVQLRHGPQLYFGTDSQLTQKWAAAVAVLQNKDSVGASYIDVTDPQRPAPGSGVSQQQAANLGLAINSAASGTTGSAGTSGVGTTAANTATNGG
jgi:cell division septal protein FtsQ